MQKSTRNTTPLASAFESLYDKTTNHLDFPVLPKESDKLLTSVAGANCSKTWTRIKTPQELFTTSKISLLLSDVSILYGMGGNEIVLKILKPDHGPDEFIVPIEDAEKLQGKPFATGWGHFPQEVIASWVEDAAPLIEDGRLAYFPDRVIWIQRNEGEESTYEVLNAAHNTPFNVLRPIREQSSKDMDILSDEDASAPSDILLDLLNLELPFLRNFSLSDYHRLLNDEHDAVIRLRGALQTLLSELYETAAETDERAAIKRKGLEIREQIVRPELSHLMQRFESITRMQKLQAAGVALGTAALCVTSILAPSVTAYAALIGGPGVVNALKQHAERISEHAKLRDSPYYMLWRIKRESANRIDGDG